MCQTPAPTCLLDGVGGESVLGTRCEAVKWGGDAIRASLGAEAGGLGCVRFLVHVCVRACVQHQETTEVQGPAQKVACCGDGWWEPTAQVGAHPGVLHLSLFLRFLGQPGSLGDQRCPGAVLGPVGCGAELREAGTPASRPALWVLPPALPKAATPRIARGARFAPAPHSPSPGSPLLQPLPLRRPGGRPRPPCGLSSGCCSCCYSAGPRARSVPQHPQVGRASRAGADPPGVPGCYLQDAGDREQGPYFACVRPEGAHFLLLSEGQEGIQPGTRDHSRKAFAFLCSSLLPLSAALGGVPVGLGTAWEPPEDGRHPGTSVAV